LVTIAIAADTKSTAYQKGTITQEFSPQHKSYDLKNGDNGYRINNCGDFQTGQEVDYRVKDKNVFIRREDGEEYKCAIEATLGITEVATPPTSQQGTIEGYEIRYLTSEGGFGGIRKVKAYELRGPDSVYEIAFCGSFEEGQFTAGQVVEYRVVGDRLNIRHDNNKEWSCQIVGKVKPEDTKPAEEAAAPSVPAATSAASTAKLSITSVPDGADIEVDGNFSGNTPSDLQVPEGEHSIIVKKSGYKAWQRNMKVAAGSSIRLNAELEKTTNP
jgi:hypothetical protein